LSDPIVAANFHADRIKNLHGHPGTDGYAKAQYHYQKLDEIMFSAREWNELRAVRDIYLKSEKLIKEMRAE
jgi:hypothetical protein